MDSTAYVANALYSEGDEKISDKAINIQQFVVDEVFSGWQLGK